MERAGEGQGIKAALGTTSPRLLLVPGAPAHAFWGVSPVGVGEGAHPAKVHI